VSRVPCPFDPSLPCPVIAIRYPPCPAGPGIRARAPLSNLAFPARPRSVPLHLARIWRCLHAESWAPQGPHRFAAVAAAAAAGRRSASPDGLGKARAPRAPRFALGPIGPALGTATVPPAAGATGVDRTKNAMRRPASTDALC
jgi:hypothetical protein